MAPNARAGVWGVSVLSAILLAGLVSWFLNDFERPTREIHVGYSDAARRNPFLAEERFLARLGFDVESRSGRDLLRDLPPPNNVIVFRGLGALNIERCEALHHWIERGGRLVLAAERVSKKAQLPGRRKSTCLTATALS